MKEPLIFSFACLDIIVVDRGQSPPMRNPSQNSKNTGLPSQIWLCCRMITLTLSMPTPSGLGIQLFLRLSTMAKLQEDNIIREEVRIHGVERWHLNCYSDTNFLLIWRYK
ncbi:hypothetical protein SUGI_0236590 [Cryptomeria japonica]|nr:hypothetical protein SUGI_0236590 [Cryptomeria japonica]